jgi:hypothetical protein
VVDEAFAKAARKLEAEAPAEVASLPPQEPLWLRAIGGGHGVPDPFESKWKRSDLNCDLFDDLD